MTTIGDLCCEVCGITSDVAALHRANPKGEKGRWRCGPHMDAPVDPEVLKVTDAVQLGVHPRDLPDVHVVGEDDRWR